MELHRIVYNDGVISVGLVFAIEDEPKRHLSLAIRWLQPRPYTAKDGRKVQTTNKMGGETDWFVLPSTFGSAIGRVLVEQKAAGMEDHFDDDGFAVLVKWLVDDEELHDCMCY